MVQAGVFSAKDCELLHGPTPSPQSSLAELTAAFIFDEQGIIRCWRARYFPEGVFFLVKIAIKLPFNRP